jgi:hypothetical protein
MVQMTLHGRNEESDRKSHSRRQGSARESNTKRPGYEIVTLLHYTVTLVQPPFKIHILKHNMSAEVQLHTDSRTKWYSNEVTI